MPTLRSTRGASHTGVKGGVVMDGVDAVVRDFTREADQVGGRADRVVVEYAAKADQLMRDTVAVDQGDVLDSITSDSHAHHDIAGAVYADAGPDPEGQPGRVRLPLPRTRHREDGTSALRRPDRHRAAVPVRPGRAGPVPTVTDLAQSPYLRAVKALLTGAGLTVGSGRAPKSSDGNVVTPVVVLYLQPSTRMDGSVDRSGNDARLTFRTIAADITDEGAAY